MNKNIKVAIAIISLVVSAIAFIQALNAWTGSASD